jgi:type IX secretion system substrate protein
MKQLLVCLFCLVQLAARAQFPPQAGLSGSTAISAASAQFVGWAAQCTIQRGLRNIAIPDSGYASLGDSSLATGPADNTIVSLGDSGVATLTFANPVIDGSGADFAVFENGFIDGADPAKAFLELAFVEVSSDGINYFRFPATSLTQDTTQLGNGNYIDASKLNNLAGKYIATYGTPFDLQELAGITGLDISNVTHIRIIDVVGSVGAHASHDNAGRVINDPYPTPFASCGFDLDAVGVIHQSGTSVISVAGNVSVSAFPNPATDLVTISINGTVPPGLSVVITSTAGYKLQELPLSQHVTTVGVAHYPTGLYYLMLCDANGNKWVEKLIKR